MYQAREAPKVIVSRIQCATEFYGDGGKMGIGGQIAGGSGSQKKIAKNAPMIGPGRYQANVGQVQPRVAVSDGLFARQRPRKDSMSGSDPEEGKND